MTFPRSSLRGGGFGGGSLDPFGGGRGGLGRYNITGATIQSIAEYEAYATAVAWANGSATDEEYLASLEQMVSLAPEGTRERVTAENRLRDARYSIGRNKLTREVNRATEVDARIDAYRALLAYDEAHLATMSATESEAYREQQDRIMSIRGDIRQARYAALVDRVNQGQASTRALFDLANSLQSEARATGDADLDEWGATVLSLRQRLDDERVAQSFQDYQHNRVTGAAVIAELDGRLAGLDPSSAMYKELLRQREDLVERVTGDERQKREADTQGRRAAGTMTDQEYLEYLRASYEEATPGTSDAIYAGNRLREFTFSLAEDKLRFDVEKGTRPVGDLVSFYRSYQRTMLPGSERWRSLELTIDRLGRSGAGGGGGSGSGPRGSIALGPKLIGGDAALADILGRAGGKAPPGFADLFRIDVTDTTARKWWDNNLRSMVDAFSDGDRTWVYFDKAGVGHELPFEPSMMAEMDTMNLRYARAGLATADTAKETQDWVGRLITASKALEQRHATYTMDVYDQVYGQIERAKERSLAGGRFGEYENLVFEQQALTRAVLGIEPGGPLDLAAATNPYLTGDQRNRVAANLARLAPQNFDEQSEFYNPDGDAVLGLIATRAIEVRRDADGWALDATLDPNRGFVTQKRDGSIGLVVVDPTDPAQMRFVPDPEGEDQLVPRYFEDWVPVRIRYGGEDALVWQEKAQVIAGPTERAGPSVYRRDPGIPRYASSFGQTLAHDPVNPIVSERGSYERVFQPGQATPASVPIVSTFTIERGQTVTWLSVDGATWVRVPPGSLPPRLVLTDPAVSINDQGEWVKDGKRVDPLQFVRFWGPGDSLQTGDRFGVADPHQRFDFRVASTTNGTLDFRPGWVLEAEEFGTQLERKAAAGRAERNRRQPAQRTPTEQRAWRFERSGEILPPELRKATGVPGIDRALLAINRAARGVKDLQRIAAPRPPLRQEIAPAAPALPGPKPPPLPQLDPLPTPRPVPQLNPIPEIRPLPAPEPTRPPAPGSATRTKDDAYVRVGQTGERAERE